MERDERNLRIQAGRLEELAANLSRLGRKDMEQSWQELSAEFKGEAAEKYFLLEQALQQELLETAGRLEAIGEALQE